MTTEHETRGHGSDSARPAAVAAAAAGAPAAVPIRRNAHRVCGDPLPVTGSCLRLWSRSAIRDATHSVLSKPKHPQEWDAHAGLFPRSHPDPGAVSVRYGSAPDRRVPRSAPIPRVDPLRDAWIEMFLPHFSDPDCWFVTLTYADAYGFPHGIVKARNALRDFSRFIAPWDGVRAWVDCAEPHQCRPIWHHHVLLAGLTDHGAASLRHEWSTSRGFADVVPLHDGGVSYATKYALKTSDVAFDWFLPW